MACSSLGLGPSLETQLEGLLTPLTEIRNRGRLQNTYYFSFNRQLYFFQLNVQKLIVPQDTSSDIRSLPHRLRAIGQRMSMIYLRLALENRINGFTKVDLLRLAQVLHTQKLDSQKPDLVRYDDLNFGQKKKRYLPTIYP